MNNFTNFFKTTFLAAGVLAVVSSCVKNDDWDNPPIACSNKFEAPTMSMADFAAQAPATGFKLIETDQIFDGYVISSDSQSNFYKTISFQDKTSNPTVGLQIEVDKASNFADYPVGAHIRINAKGLRLGLDRGTLKLGSVDPVFAIGRIPQDLVGRYVSGVCGGNGLDIQTIIPTKLASLADAKQANLINTLVTVSDAQFNIGELFPVHKKYIDYDAAGQPLDTDRNIEDKMGGTAVVRNSSFFKGGGELLPKGSGDITFVVSRYNTTWQMLIRSLSDIQFTGSTRVDPTPPKGGTEINYLGAFLENFESYSPTNLEVYPKYINDPVLGNRYWQLKTFSSNKYIQLGANSGTGNYLTYFAVPVDFTTANQLKFDVNVGYWNGNALKVYYTTNYTPLGDITAATKVDITSAFTIPQTPAGPNGGYGTLTPAGTYDIPASVTGNGFILFEYSGNGSGVTTTIQLDNIQVL
ncbi:MAG: DUF5689 domain-containing protein [Chryseobacterium sp.]|jgi:hypothetical protein|uniref:DUF5689 domain-containing protein n=1 Tax=Chryseobacterium sp. TaxID=1871047 RepID=UPI0028282E4F|nr:DUF5689 domain-containing protein [Chryseobacterium sp.]MDR2234524.1 DUF5689 domain-containing protein [Chryseobacterium sp.]